MGIKKNFGWPFLFGSAYSEKRKKKYIYIYMCVCVVFFFGAKEPKKNQSLAFARQVLYQ
jgi:hypothetical protein